MNRSVQFWLKLPEGLAFIAMVDAIVDPWDTVHITLSPDKLRELISILSEHTEQNDDITSGIQDKPQEREENIHSSDE